MQDNFQIRLSAIVSNRLPTSLLTTISKLIGKQHDGVFISLHHSSDAPNTDFLHQMIGYLFGFFPLNAAAIEDGIDRSHKRPAASSTGIVLGAVSFLASSNYVL